MKKTKPVLTKSELKNLICNFCEKKQADVKKLIAGPGCYICNECIDKCNEVVAEDKQRKLVAEDQKNLVKEIADLVIEYIAYKKKTEKKKDKPVSKKSAVKPKAKSKAKVKKA